MSTTSHMKILQPSLREANVAGRVLLVCGVLASVVYVLADVFAALSILLDARSRR